MGDISVMIQNFDQIALKVIDISSIVYFLLRPAKFVSL